MHESKNKKECIKSSNKYIVSAIRILLHISTTYISPEMNHSTFWIFRIRYTIYIYLYVGNLNKTKIAGESNDLHELKSIINIYVIFWPHHWHKTNMWLKVE